MSNPEPIIDPEEPPGKGSNISPRFRIEKRNPNINSGVKKD